MGCSFDVDVDAAAAVVVVVVVAKVAYDPKEHFVGGDDLKG